MEGSCPNCGSETVTEIIVRDWIPYRDNDGNVVKILAPLPIRHCCDCLEEWENNKTFIARDMAINTARAITTVLPTLPLVLPLRPR